MPLFGNSKSVVLAEGETNKLRDKQKDLEAEISLAQRHVARKRDEKAQYHTEQRTACEAASRSDDEKKRLLEEIEQANRIQLSLNSELIYAERQHAACIESSRGLRQRLQRLEDMHAALQTALHDGQSKREDSLSCLAPQANEHVAKSHDALRNGIIEQSSKASMLEIEAGCWQSQTQVIAGELSCLSHAHRALRLQDEALQDDIRQTLGRECALRSKLFEVMSELESARLNIERVKNAHGELESQIEIRSTLANAVSSTYHNEVHLVSPILELTKARNQEAVAIHVEQVREIQSATEARARRHSRDATVSDCTQPSKVCLAPSYPSRDLCPKLKTKEWYKVNPNSTGIFLPCPEATEYRSSDFSLWGRMVVGSDARRTDSVKS